MVKESLMQRFNGKTADKSFMDKVFMVFVETILALVFLFLSINVYFLIFSIIKAGFGFPKEFFENYFANFGSGFLKYLLNSIIIVLVLYLKKMIIKQRYSLQSNFSWKLSFHTFAVILVEFAFFTASLALTTYFLSLARGINFLELSKSVNGTSEIYYLLILALPVYLIFSTIINLVLIQSFIPNRDGKRRLRILRGDVKFAVLLALIQPLTILAFRLFLSKNMVIFFDLINSLFKPPIT